SVGWLPPARCRSLPPHWGAPSSPGTGGRRRRAIPHSASGPPHKSYRRRGWTCRSRKHRESLLFGYGEGRSRYSLDYGPLLRGRYPTRASRTRAGHEGCQAVLNLAVGSAGGIALVSAWDPSATPLAARLWR